MNLLNDSNKRTGSFSHTSTGQSWGSWSYELLCAMPSYQREWDTNHPLDSVVQPGLPTPILKFSKCCSKVSQESVAVLTENSRVTGYINYSFTMGSVLLKELKNTARAKVTED